MLRLSFSSSALAIVALILIIIAAFRSKIRTTLEGPFEPVMVPFDLSLWGNAVDLPNSDPRVQRRANGFDPKSVSLSSNYDSVWISWITDPLSFTQLSRFFQCWKGYCHTKGGGFETVSRKTAATYISQMELAPTATLAHFRKLPYMRPTNFIGTIGEDLATVDRSITPWLVAAWHPPWYSSYHAHYREAECMRVAMEELLYSYGVDIVFTGHVHAYERSNRVYNYALDPCGPVHITVGDGGIERKWQLNLLMSMVTAQNLGQLQIHTWEVSVQQTLQLAQQQVNFAGIGNLITVPSGKAALAMRFLGFCVGVQGGVKNVTWALWTWYRNQDSQSKTGDQIYIVRQPDRCPARPKVTKGWFSAR
ncbi:Purple acid phosphatase [Actinidia chinensis var. chinensis]|uniref:acid phosphatase n=1 Tax=Actinidia chinensis var. chinensis TaxID=1590841 RepID=A0A2R6PPA7_ACTCC|nr:Purple acid phosphatase [Actinidia chinensis var. chinensis]